MICHHIIIIVVLVFVVVDKWYIPSVICAATTDLRDRRSRQTPYQNRNQYIYASSEFLRFCFRMASSEDRIVFEDTGNAPCGQIDFYCVQSQYNIFIKFYQLKVIIQFITKTNFARFLALHRVSSDF